MDNVTLGRTDLRVSPVCFGCWQMGSAKFWGAVDEDQRIASVHKALEMGINFFDTADAYGDGLAEEILGSIPTEPRSVPTHAILKKFNLDFESLCYALKDQIEQGLVSVSPVSICRKAKVQDSEGKATEKELKVPKPFLKNEIQGRLIQVFLRDPTGSFSIHDLSKKTRIPKKVLSEYLEEAVKKGWILN